MCSIFGHINFSKDLISKSKFIEASNIMTHRGPDKNNYFSDENKFQFAFNRLSILDLTEFGDQPMISNCGRYVCIFNGEIYNYKEIFEEIRDKFKWNGTSDTEVLLNAWSVWNDKIFDKVDGMFAFAIWDNELQNLFIARDRMGEKPLYYYKKNNSLIFSSRPEAILKIFPEISKSYENETLNFYLSSGYFPSSKSFFKEIKKLEPGSYINFSDKKFIIKKYWNINDFFPISKKENNWELYAETCEKILISSIKERLSSDKPLGFFLSGGLDSSLIVAIASKILKKKNVIAFNLGFEDKEYDESKDALNVAHHLGINLEYKTFTSSEMLALLPYFFEKFDEPFADSSCFPLMALSKFAKKQVDVVVTGDGGDELFGGYNYYSLISLFNKLDLPLKIFNKIISNLQLNKIGGHKFKLINETLKYKNIFSKFAFMRSMRKDFKNVLDEGEILKYDLIEEFTRQSNLMKSENDIVDKCLKLDLQNTLRNNYLQKTDLSTMAYSLECRAPFLSREMVEWALKIPSKFKVNKFEKKIIIKNLAERYLPREIINKKKSGFELPIKNWLRKELKSWAMDLIKDEKNYTNLPLNKEKILEIYNLHISKKRDCHPYLWAILMLLNYNKKNLIYKN